MNNLGRGVSIIFRVYQAEMSQNLKQYDIGLSEYPILLNLDSDGEGVSQNLLAHRIKLDKALVSRCLKKLHQKGLIDFKSSSSHAAKKCVYLTTRSRTLVPKIRAISNSWQENVLGNIPESDTEHLYSILGKLYERSEQLYTSKS